MTLVTLCAQSTIFDTLVSGTEGRQGPHDAHSPEPIESELAKQVEYDMDEQGAVRSGLPPHGQSTSNGADQEWLDAVNAERKKEQSGLIAYEVFEIIMDRLEKEWFNLVKRIPQPASHMPVEDTKCAICDDGEGDNTNAIVFCDGCNLAVHQGEPLLRLC